MAWNLFADKVLLKVASWGRHLILKFSHQTFRIHFLTLGSYRIDHEKENLYPKVRLSYSGHEVYFYNCSVKEIAAADLLEYDPTIDVMSPEWDPKKAKRAILHFPSAFVCDVLMDQMIFAGAS